MPEKETLMPDKEMLMSDKEETLVYDAEEKTLALDAETSLNYLEYQALPLPAVYGIGTITSKKTSA